MLADVALNAAQRTHPGAQATARTQARERLAWLGLVDVVGWLVVMGSGVRWLWCCVLLVGGVCLVLIMVVCGGEPTNITQQFFGFLLVGLFSGSPLEVV